ncbi:unnamed protein product [Rhizophagus irregularis]|nr:unnamed protein product [Rhizophagus irregularis]
MVRHLQLLDDPIVSKLKKSELNPIMLENAYHSPEESEVDSDNDSNENLIYASGEKTASLNAPRWTRSGYKGLMLSIITRELKKYRENDDDDDIEHHSRKKPKSVEGIHDDDDDIGHHSRKKPKSVEGIHNVK